jgi:hypothetical protein
MRHISAPAIPPTFLLAAVLVVAALAVACGSASRSSSPTSVATSSPVSATVPPRPQTPPAPTAVATSPTPVSATVLPPPQTPLALAPLNNPLDVALVTVQGDTAKFAVEVPQGWTHEAIDSRDWFSLKAPEGYTLAFTTIECGDPKTLDPSQPYTSRNLALQETRGLAPNSPSGSTGEVTDLFVNGLAAATYDDTRSLGSAGFISTSVFIAEPACAWTLRFTITAKNDTVQAYRVLFGRIVASFRPSVG